MIDETRLQDYVARDPNIEIKNLYVQSDDDGTTYIFGLYKEEGTWDCTSWDMNGFHSFNGYEQRPLDLILGRKNDFFLHHSAVTDEYWLTEKQESVDDYPIRLHWREVDGKTELVSVEVVK